MPAKKERRTSFFRPLVGDAIAHAWYHRELWPIAAIAGMAGIGAGINDVLTQARLSSTLPGVDPLTLITSVSFTRGLLENIVVQGPKAVILTVILTIFFGTLCALLLAWSQHITLRASHHAITQKKPLTLNELAKDAAHPRILRILTIDAFIKVLILNVIIVASVLISGLNPSQYFFDALFGTLFSGFMIALAFALNIWGMLALIFIVKKNVTITTALGNALKLLKHHPVACIELSLLLFAATFAISLVAIVGLILIGSLSIPFFSIMISQGTMLGITIVTFCTVVLGTTWAIAGAGFSTLVTYLSWTTLSESLESQKTSSVSRGAVHVKRTIGHLFG